MLSSSTSQMADIGPYSEPFLSSYFCEIKILASHGGILHRVVLEVFAVSFLSQ